MADAEVEAGDPARGLALAREALENYRVALGYLEDLARTDPDDVGHQRWLALTYSALGGTGAARPERSRLLLAGKKRSRSANAWSPPIPVASKRNAT